MKALLAAIQFLTIIPVGTNVDEEAFERAPAWFPTVGLLIGAIAAAGDAVLSGLSLAPHVQSVFSIGLLAALSGGLHLDGLADTADGFLSARPREQVLNIMRDSRIGTMGALALLFVLLLKVTALADLATPTRWRALLLAPLAGRCAQLALLNTLAYARNEGGLASVFVRRRCPTLPVWVALGFLVVAGSLLGVGKGLSMTAFVGVVTILSGVWCKKRIGGFTGDTLGATSEVIEASVLAWATLGL